VSGSQSKNVNKWCENVLTVKGGNNPWAGESTVGTTPENPAQPGGPHRPPVLHSGRQVGIVQATQRECV